MSNHEVFYRNLNLIRTLGRSRYVWSRAQLAGNVGRGKVQGNTLDGADVVIADVTANVQLGTLKRIRERNTREVGAWLIGARADSETNLGALRRFSLDPCTQTAFTYCDDQTPVHFPLSRVVLRTDGAYAAS